MNSTIEAYSRHYLDANCDNVYPAELIIRIFLGQYPELSLSKDYGSKKLLDCGFGDGRNFQFYLNQGFKAYGTEVTNDITEKSICKYKLSEENLKVGFNHNLPFANSFFDYLVSWNASYYMIDIESSYQSHLKEYSRILKRSRYLVLSVPDKCNFIYNNVSFIDDRKRYVRVDKDPYKVRENQLMRYFSSKDDLINDLSHYFSDISYASISMNCFGECISHHIVVCRNNESNE